MSAAKKPQGRPSTLEQIKKFTEVKNQEPYFEKIQTEFTRMNVNMKNCLSYLNHEIKENPESF